MQDNNVTLHLPDCEGDTPLEAVENFIAQASQDHLWVYRVRMQDGSEWLVDMAGGPSVTRVEG